MLASLSYQVLMRYAFNQAPPWTEELALTCFSWAMLLSIGLGVRDGIHVRMDLLLDRLPSSIRKLVERLISLSIAIFGLYLMWYGIDYVRDEGSNVSAAMAYPLAYLYACAPVCGFLIAAFGFERALCGAAPAATQ
ncbi:TRAP transporter small permease [Diaphorobacter sp. HDW4A]|uniref:TRAP transporter small permease n=1 Tax=Diaphorobacter sp. HDW4A TaxID=2714924 RepID=UPI001407DEAE|nr:TRAP transporter small permease [Diaphorobacter sp. HDW4A]QIL79976.1 TRAP transporter small permease [Diaphorobacter sp. HDW4A]